MDGRYRGRKASDRSASAGCSQSEAVDQSTDLTGPLLMKGAGILIQSFPMKLVLSRHFSNGSSQFQNTTGITMDKSGSL
jgi:hypothetical protein